MVTPSGSRRLSFLGQSPSRALALKGARILTALQISNDWEKRVSALEELAEFIASKSHSTEQLADLLRDLRQPLKANVLDRRSAVCKQACYLVSRLALGLPKPFEPLAVYLLPDIIKLTAISIQVIAEATLGCAGAIVDHCHSHRMLPCICETIVESKSARLRQNCLNLLLKVLQIWPSSAVQPMCKQIEAGLVKGCQDAISDSRAVSRQSIELYLATFPGRYDYLWDALPAAVQKRLLLGSDNTGDFASPTQSVLAPADLQRQGFVRSSVSRIPRAPIRQHEKDQQIHAVHQQNEKQNKPRKSLHASALRVSVPALKIEGLSLKRAPSGASSLDSSRSGGSNTENQALEGNGRGEGIPFVTPRPSRPGLFSVTPAAKRMHQSALRVSTQSLRLEGRREVSPPKQRVPQTALKTLNPKAQRMRQSLALEASAMTSVHKSMMGMPPTAAKAHRLPPQRQSLCVSRSTVFRQPRQDTVADLLLALKRGFPKWQDKLGALEKIGNVASDSPLVIAHPNNADLFADTLVSFTSDPHAKVASGALSQAAALLQILPEFWSGHRILAIVPALLLRIGDTREVVRNQAEEAIEAFASQLGIAKILPGLTKTLHSTKVPRIISAALSIFCNLYEDLSEDDHAPDPSHLRQWRKHLRLLESDKNGELRRLATEAQCLLAHHAQSGLTPTQMPRVHQPPTTPGSTPRRRPSSGCTPVEIDKGVRSFVMGCLPEDSAREVGLRQEGEAELDPLSSVSGDVSNASLTTHARAGVKTGPLAERDVNLPTRAGHLSRGLDHQAPLEGKENLENRGLQPPGPNKISSEPSLASLTPTPPASKLPVHLFSPSIQTHSIDTVTPERLPVSLLMDDASRNSSRPAADTPVAPDTPTANLSKSTALRNPQRSTSERKLQICEDVTSLREESLSTDAAGSSAESCLTTGNVPKEGTSQPEESPSGCDILDSILGGKPQEGRSNMLQEGPNQMDACFSQTDDDKAFWDTLHSCIQSLPAESAVNKIQHQLQEASSLLSRHPISVNSESALTALLSHRLHAHPQLRRQAIETLTKLCHSAPDLPWLQHLTKMLVNCSGVEKAAANSGSLEVTAEILQKASLSADPSVQRSFAEALRQFLSNPDAGIRKATVACFAVMSLKPEAFPISLIEGLVSSSQMRLIRIVAQTRAAKSS